MALAAVTDSNELSDLKCIIFSSGDHASTELKIRVWQSCLPSEGAREEPASLLFPASGGHPWSLTHDPYLPSSSQQGLARSLVMLPSLWFSLPSLPFLLMKTLLIMLCPPG